MTPVRSIDDLPPFVRRETVTQMVGSRTTDSLAAHPQTVEQCRTVLACCHEKGLTSCPRGSGHSYGDQALNDGQLLLDMRGMDSILDFDLETGRIVVDRTDLPWRFRTPK